MHYKHRLYSAWPQVEDFQVLTTPETLLSVIQVAPFNSFCIAIYSLGQHDEMWSRRQQFYKESFCRAIRNHMVDLVQSSAQIMLDPFIDSVCTNPVLPLQVYICLQCLQLRLSFGDLPWGSWGSFIHLSPGAGSVMGVDLRQWLVGERCVWRE